MKDLKYKIALVAYYGPLTIATILCVCFIVLEISKSIQLNSEINSLRQSIKQEILK